MGLPVPGAGRPLDSAGNRGTRQMTVPGASAPGTESGLRAAPAVILSVRCQANGSKKRSVLRAVSAPGTPSGPVWCRSSM